MCPSSLAHIKQEGQQLGKKVRIKPKGEITYSFEGVRFCVLNTVQSYWKSLSNVGMIILCFIKFSLVTL